MKRVLVAIVIVCWAFVTGAHAQTVSKDDARRDIENTYNFNPATMSFSEQANRAPSLTALWDRYDKSPDVYRNALRTALAAGGQPEMLYCDGGMLLLHKSKIPDDRQLGLTAVSKCTLSEIEQTPYFYMVHELAREGLDTLDMQFLMLTKPRYSAFIVPHALNLGQDYAFVYPLLLQEETRYVPRVAERIKTETDETAMRSLTLALWYAATPQSERTLRSIAHANSTYSKVAKDAAQEMVERIDQTRGLSSLGPTVSSLWLRAGLPFGAGEAEIRAKRRARMRSISDEALIDLDIYTPLLYRTFK